MGGILLVEISAPVTSSVTDHIDDMLQTILGGSSNTHVPDNPLIP